MAGCGGWRSDAKEAHRAPARSSCCVETSKRGEVRATLGRPIFASLATRSRSRASSRRKRASPPSADPGDSCDCLEVEAEGTTVAVRVRGAGGGRVVASFVFDLSASVESCAVSRGLTEEQSRGGRVTEWAV